jgi:hypothetical protein
VFVDVILVSAGLYIINFADYYQNGPEKLEKKLRKEEKVKKAITIGKQKEIVQKYESGRFGTHYGYFHCFLWEKYL